MDTDLKPVWKSSSFLVYAGGLTVLFSAIGALGYLAVRYGHAAFAGWALLVLVVLSAIAFAFKHRDRWVAAGIFAFASVIAWGLFVGALWVWFAWLSVHDLTNLPFKGFSVARLSLLLLILVAALVDRRTFRFPFITLLIVSFGWLFVTDFFSGGGSWSAVVTLVVGLAYVAIGGSSDRPAAFWYHLAGGLLIGGSLLYWWHGGDWQWALICVVALLYVGMAHRTDRSSWAVLGALALLAAASHFSNEWSTGSGSSLGLLGGFGIQYRGWVPPLVFAFTGFLLVALGLVVARRRPA
ncbi:MAG: hypothetical protein ABI990_12125 [Actinomycetota bacterium]